MTQMVKTFKKYNLSWERTKSIMTDKDFQERNAFRKEFPDAVLLICLFHCLRTFRREITTEKMGITTGERDICLELVQKMAYAKNENDYNDLFQMIKDTKLNPVVKYMQKNWHPIRTEWVISLQQVVTLGNRTNNRLEALNSKVVQVVKRHSPLPSLFKDLDNLLLSLRTELDNRAAQTHLKVPLSIVVTSEDQRHYLQLLTPYAYGLVADKFKYKDRVNVEGHCEGETVIVKSTAGSLVVSPDNCSCSFFASMQLPCHHILKVRELKQMSLFSPNLVSTRWTKSYYVSSSRISKQVTYEEAVCSTSTVATARVLSQHEKFRLVSGKVQKLVSLASEASSRLFPQRLKVLDSIINIWGRSCEVCVSANEETVNADEFSTLEESRDGENEMQQKLVFNHLESHSHLVINNAESSTSMVLTDRSSQSNIVQPQELMESPSLNVSSLQTVKVLENLPVLPPNMKKRGRPKGIDKTVVGLPAKRKMAERKHPRHK